MFFKSNQLSRRDFLQLTGAAIVGSGLWPSKVWGLGGEKAQTLTPHLTQSERTLNLYHIHTRETLKKSYWSNGNYTAEAMKEVDTFLRDWRTNQSIPISPELMNLLFLIQQKLNYEKPIEIICGYRCPKTNDKLCKDGGGVAKRSKHMTGHAIDFRFPGVPLHQVRDAAKSFKAGGVGYYPGQFVHIDIREKVAYW